MIAQALRQFVMNIPGVGAVIGTRLYTRVAPPLKPQSEKPIEDQVPYIVMQRISTPRERHLTGSSNLPHPRWQFSLYGTDAEVLETLGNTIRLGFDHKRNLTIALEDGSGEVNIRSVILEDERDDFEPPQHSEKIGLYRKDLDFIIWHREAVPV